MANYVADVQVLDAESQRRVPVVPDGTRIRLSAHGFRYAVLTRILQVIIVTCMDCRIDVWSMFRLQPSQAHVIRNAGGRPQDALRSILLSLHIVAPGSNQIWVVQHTECGMMSRDPNTTLTNAALRTRLLDAPALRAHRESIQKRINAIDYLPITEPSLEDSVRADVRWLREQQPLIPANTVLRGFVYHVPRAPRLETVQIPLEHPVAEPMWE